MTYAVVIVVPDCNFLYLFTVLLLLLLLVVFDCRPMYYALLVVSPTVTCCVCQHSIKALLTYLLT